MKTRKRLFIGLVLLSLAVIIATSVLAWYLTITRGGIVQKVILVVGGGLFLLLISMVSIGILALVLALWKSKTFPSLQNLMILATNMLFPVALRLGNLLGLDKDKIKSSFIEVNNQLVKGRDLTVQPEQIMILAPHCLQRVECPHKITIDAYNCKRCGKCPIDDLHRVAERYGVKLVVATGGTLARKFIKTYRPRAVVAIACERDLTSGIQDANPLPVLGVLNIRPEGPCLNTQVNLSMVEEAVCHFLRGHANYGVAYHISHR